MSVLGFPVGDSVSNLISYRMLPGGRQGRYAFSSRIDTSFERTFGGSKDELEKIAISYYTRTKHKLFLR